MMYSIRTTLAKKLSLVAASALVLITYFSFLAHSNPGGITGTTNKPTNRFPGCTCHSNSPSSNTTVTIAPSGGVSQFVPGQTYTFTVTVDNANQVNAGVNLSAYKGTLSTANTDLGISSKELYQRSPKSISASGAIWTFKYKVPATGTTDTIYATGNAVNGNGTDDFGDEWNFAPKFVVNITSITITKAIGLGRTTIALGKVRVGSAKSDTLIVRSTSTAAISVSSAIKSGAPFSSIPSSGSHMLASGASEIDTVIFAPTARGAFKDSLIVTSDVDLQSDQRQAVLITGTGIQGIFSAAVSTVDFSTVGVGLSKRTAFLYSNTGDDTLFIQPPTLSGGGYTVVSGPARLSLPPGVKDSIVIEFDPTVEQAYSATLDIPVSNGNIQTESVALSGIGSVGQAVGSAPLQTRWEGIVSPNPSRGNASLRLTVPHSGEGEIALYDVRGTKLVQAYSGLLAAGEQRINLNLGAIPQGTYFLRINSGGIPVGESRIVIER